VFQWFPLHNLITVVSRTYTFKVLISSVNFASRDKSSSEVILSVAAHITHLFEAII